jgi:hypothetical protein
MATAAGPADWAAATAADLFAFPSITPTNSSPAWRPRRGTMAGNRNSSRELRLNAPPR